MTLSAVPSDAFPYQPGQIVAGRYRLVFKMGPDGEVWRADDLVFEAPVALRVFRPASPDQRERILERLNHARRVTHPGLCPVFEVGETDGCLFCSTQLVRGEDLATLLRRAGRLPSTRVIEIGVQICDALAAAHAEGLLHLRLAPSTVLLDDDGAVRIVGLDSAPPARVHSPGVADSLAPEQRTPGAPLTVQTDLYAVGLILYELLTGIHAYRDGNAAIQPMRPSAIVPDASAPLERAVLQALKADPQERPASAAALAAHLVAVSSARSHGLRPWLAGAALAAIMGGLSLLATWLLPSGQRTLSERDMVLVADVANTTGDSVFDGALKVALAVALEQSPFLRVFPDQRARETLQLMQRRPDEPLAPALAREVARREQLKALVVLSIGPLGAGYVLTLEAIDAATGASVAREQLQAPAKDDVLDALGTATARLRSRLGESLASVQRFDVPLPRATTASLEALHAYAQALDQGRLTVRTQAIPHLLRAVELDPEFAMAHALLSGVYANTGRSAEAPAFSRRAFELRDRVSERERFFISWRYYVDAAQAWDRALELAHAWTATYPGEAIAFNSLGIASAAFGDHASAVRAFQSAITLDPAFVPPHGNLAGSLIALERFGQARALLEEASGRGIDFISVRRMAWLLAFIANDEAAMARELEIVRTSSDAIWALVWQGRGSTLRGRVADAHRSFQAAVGSAIRGDLRELAGQWTAEDAEAHAVAGDCDIATAEVRAALRSSRDNFTLERAARTLALCGDAAGAAALTAELSTRFPTAALTARIHLPIVAAASALARRDGAAALGALESVKPYDYAPSAEFWPAYLRGHAYLLAGDGRNARAQFEAILRRRGAAPTSPLYALSHLGVGRAAALSGDPAAARRGYETFLALWGEADAASPVLRAARGEYARLPR